MITIKVPGKLMLAGEWSILEPGNRCIVMALNKYMTASITSPQDSQEKIFGQFSLPDLNLPLISTHYQDGKLSVTTQLTQQQEKQFSLVKIAAEKTLAYLSEQQITPFMLTLTSEISTTILQDGSHEKMGFGSSSACIIATIKALFAHAGLDITTQANQERIFKLAIIAHYTAQGSCGSGFDIAAATYGTTLAYQRFYQIPQDTTQLDRPWPGLKISPIKLPRESIVLVGFTGKSASTPDLIRSMNEYKKRNPEVYTRIISSINTIVEDLEAMLRSPQVPLQKILATIKQNRLLLAELASSAKLELETPELTTLINIAEQHGACAKFSGAGGGDCGIALCSDAQRAEDIKIDWRNNGIIPVDVQIL